MKFNKLRSDLKKYGSVLVAYSGGLDSAFLLKTAIDTIGKENVLAVTARSETYPYSEYREAIQVAQRIGARHITIKTSELGIKNFKENPVNRCYYCKKELFKILADIAKKRKFAAVLDGTNYDDLKDIRYGRKAAKELGIRSPLLEAKIGKAEIRKYSKKLGLPTWHKPSFACLASRIPFNDRITAEKLGRVEKAEDYLRSLGFKQVRVRLHDNMARLEFYRDDFRRILKTDTSDRLVKKLKSLGFKYVSLDLEGYRTGSMHAAIDKRRSRV
jgi:pyridinium-3,5-biscarboxylic acid mononucleotide sulfurtransferase